MMSMLHCHAKVQLVNFVPVDNTSLRAELAMQSMAVNILRDLSSQSTSASARDLEQSVT